MLAHAIIDDAYHYLKSRGLIGNTATIPSPSDEYVDSARGSSNYSPTSEQSETSENYFSSSLKRSPRLFVLSSPEQNSLQKMADALANYVESKNAESPSAIEAMLSNLAYTLSDRRTTFQWRATFSAHSADELTSALTQRIKSGRAGKDPRIAFVFTGQGAQWHAMGRELVAHEVYANTIREADDYLKSLGADWSVWEELMASAETSRINSPQFSQPLCAVLQIALVRLLDHWGIAPTAAVGHSSGEIAAAYTAGALSAQDCWKLAYHRGRLSHDIKTICPEQKCGMLSVGLSEEEARKYLAMLAPSEVAVIACINSPSNVTVSGEDLALTKLEGLLKLDEVFARRLKVENAYHSPYMQVIADSYLESIADIKVLTPKSSAPPMFSSVTGAQIAVSELTAPYWVRNMVSPVQFVNALQAMVPSAAAGGRRRRGNLAIDTLLEVGPHSALQGPLKQILTANGRAENVSYHSLILRNQNATEAAMATIGSLWTKGQDVNFLNLNSVDTQHGTNIILTDLPTYSWNHSHRFWHETDGMKTHRFRDSPRLDLVGKPVEDFNPLAPRWKNILRLYELPWISQHKVQGTILYPAAGMLCAVLEAGLQLAEKTKKLAGMEFRDVTIGHALVVPSNESGVTMELHMKPRTMNVREIGTSWWDFTIFSLPKGGEYVEHCKGLMQMQYEPNAPDDTTREMAQEWKNYQQEYAEYQKVCKHAVNSEEFYDNLDARGLNYGPVFRPIKKIHNIDGIGCCTVEVQDTKSTMPLEYEFDHLIHPSTLDAVFQTFFSAATDCTQAMVPTAIASMYVSADLPKGPGAIFQGFATSTRQGFRHFTGPIIMSDESWEQPKIIMKGFAGTELGASSSDADTVSESFASIRKLCSSISWKEDVDHLTQHDAEILLPASQDTNKDAATIADYEKAAIIYMVKALFNLDPAKEMTMAPHLVHYVSWMRRRVELTHSDFKGQSSAEIDHLLNEVANKGADGQLLSAIGKNLGGILDGSVSPESILTKDDLLSEHRTNGLGLKSANHAMTKWLDLQAHKRPGMQYLEIAAGQGAISSSVLQTLGAKNTPRFSQYLFTDNDPDCLEAGKKTLKAWQDRVQFRKLDINAHPSNQGFEEGSIDVLLAGNVLHEVHDISAALAHCHWLLRAGGKLIFTEITETLDHVGLFMGARPSWWLANDGRVGQPLVKENEWRKHIAENFNGPDLVARDEKDPSNHCAAFMVATKQSAARELPFDSVVVINAVDMSAESTTLCDKVTEKLKHLGLHTEKATLKDAVASDADGKMLISDKAVLCLLEAEKPFTADMSSTDFDDLKKLLLGSKRGLWVSRGGIQVDPSSDPSFCATDGLLRTIRSEKPDAPIFQLDLSTQAQLQSSSVANLIVKNFKSEQEAESPLIESEVCERDGRLYIARLYDEKPMNHALHLHGQQPAPEQQPLSQPGRPLRLSIGTPGMLDTIHWIDDDAGLAPLGENEVEVEVKANGVNFM